MHFRVLAALKLGCLALVLPGPTTAMETADWIQPAINTVKSPKQEAQARVDAVALLTENWKESLPAIVENIDAYYRAEGIQPYTQDDVAGLLPLTDLAVKIILTKDGAIGTFRESDTANTIKLLTWAARDPENIEQNRNLRFNATYILAGVVDNSSLCIVLDHLRDAKLNPNGKVNLLQVAASAARFAYKENVKAALETVDIMSPRVNENPTPKSVVLLKALAGNATASPNAEMPLPFEATYCRDYDYAATPP
jgi:hypothetical protein